MSLRYLLQLQAFEVPSNKVTQSSRLPTHGVAKSKLVCELQAGEYLSQCLQESHWRGLDDSQLAPRIFYQTVTEHSLIEGVQMLQCFHPRTQESVWKVKMLPWQLLAEVVEDVLSLWVWMRRSERTFFPALAKLCCFFCKTYVSK